MKRRRPPTRRKQFRQPKKQLPPTSTDKPPASGWQMPLAEPTRTRASNPGTSGIVQPPLPLRAEANIKLEGAGLSADATVINAAPHREMLSWIEVLEGLMIELPKQRRGIGDNLQPITEVEVQEIKHCIVILKAQPVAPTAPDAVKAAGSTLKKIGEKLGTYLDACLLEASKELGKKLVSPHWWALWYALMKIVQSVGAWLP